MPKLSLHSVTANLVLWLILLLLLLIFLVVIYLRIDHVIASDGIFALTALRGHHHHNLDSLLLIKSLRRAIKIVSIALFSLL